MKSKVYSNVRVGENDLATTPPQLAAQVSPNSPFKADEVTAGSEKKILWRCDPPTAMSGNLQFLPELVSEPVARIVQVIACCQVSTTWQQ